MGKFIVLMLSAIPLTFLSAFSVFCRVIPLLLLSAVLLIGLTNCKPAPLSPEKAQTIGQEADQLFERYSPTEWTKTIPKAEYPQAIQKLNPISVHISEEGIYIVLKEFFVTESGIFILSPTSTFEPTRGTDPSYEQIHSNVYLYEIKG